MVWCKVAPFLFSQHRNDFFAKYVRRLGYTVEVEMNQTQAREDFAPSRALLAGNYRI